MNHYYRKSMMDESFDVREIKQYNVATSRLNLSL
jgi:hypothetical protein